MTPLSPWQQELYAYSKMCEGEGNPLGDIFAQLNSEDPDWKAIGTDLTEIDGDLNQMIEIAEKNHLSPASDPSFLQRLESARLDVENLELVVKNQGGKGEFTPLLNSFLTELGTIHQDILQG